MAAGVRGGERGHAAIASRQRGRDIRRGVSGQGRDGQVDPGLGPGADTEQHAGLERLETQRGATGLPAAPRCPVSTAA